MFRKRKHTVTYGKHTVVREDWIYCEEDEDATSDKDKDPYELMVAKFLNKQKEARFAHKEALKKDRKPKLCPLVFGKISRENFVC
jgi:hypothetical protein